MLPRVGGGGGNSDRENIKKAAAVPSGVPPPSPSVMASTAASRRRSVGGGGFAGGAPSPRSSHHHHKNNATPAAAAPGASSAKKVYRPRPSLSYNGGGGTPMTGRKSLAGGAGPAPLPPTIKQDTRPITEKAFQQAAMHKVLQYLQEHRYPYPVSLKTLSGPSGKDFTHIITFMLQQFDPGFQSGKGAPMKLEEELVMYFRFLGYPFTLSKTSIVAAGSPHAWPSLLAALVWLVEHYECMAAETSPDYLRDKSLLDAASLSEIGDVTDRAFYQYLPEAYQAFLKDDATLKEAAEQALINHFSYGDQRLMQEWEQQMDINSCIAERIQMLKKELERAEHLAAKREMLLVDLDQYRDLIDKMREHKATLERKVQERSNDLEKATQQVHNVQAEIQACQDQVARQTMTAQDELKLQSHSKGLSEAMERVERQKAVLHEEVAREEQDLALVQQECHTHLQAFQARISDLEDKLPPELRAPAKVAQWKKLTVDDLLQGEGTVLQEIQLLCGKGRDILEMHLKALQDKLQDALDQLGQSQQKLQKIQAQRQYFEDKTAKLQAVLGKETETHQAKLAVHQKEISALEGKVGSLQDPVALENQVAAYERQCSELEALRAKYVQDNVERRARVEQEIGESVDLMIEHDAWVQSQIKGVDDYVQAKVASAETLQPPPDLDLLPKK